MTGNETSDDGESEYDPWDWDGTGLMSAEIMVAIMVGATFVLVTISVIICCCCCWKRPRRRRDAEAQRQQHQQHLRQQPQPQQAVIRQRPPQQLYPPAVNLYPNLEGNRRSVKGNMYMREQVPPTAPSLKTQVSTGPVSDHLGFDAMAVLAGAVKNMIYKVTLDSTRLTLQDVIGKGQFGLVYKGRLMNKEGTGAQDVAVKTTYGDDCGQKEVESFMEEVMRMRGFNHVNVMTMMGLVIKENKPYVLLPFMHHGDLRTYIGEGQRNFTVEDLLKLGLQVAEGMNYLALQNFVHRDLAARNCMVNNEIVVKVADFGLSRDLFDSDYYVMEDVHAPLPVRWMAVEAIFEKKFTSMSDVWSFGVLLWELMTRGSKPYPDIPENREVVNFIKGGHRMTCPNITAQEIYTIMLRCWETKAEFRPTFSELCEGLKNILDDSGGDYVIAVRSPGQPYTPQTTAM